MKTNSQAKKTSKNLCIAVHSAKKEVHTEIRHQDTQKSHDAIHMEKSRFPESLQRRRMQRCHVDEHRYQRPDLLRVPAPVTAPGDIGPDRTHKYSDSQQKDCRTKQCMRKRRERLFPYGITFPMHDKSLDTYKHHQGKQCIRKHYHHHMHGQKR